MDKVKCAECGFLAFRTQSFHELGIPFLAEADEETRSAGNCYKNDLYDVLPICFMREKQFMTQRKALDQADLGVRTAIENMLTRKRDCQEFTPWQQGFTPKEHREMFDRYALVKRQAIQSTLHLGIALIAVVVSIIGVVHSANVNLNAAKLQADAQIKAADMQIQALRSLSSQPTSGK